MGSFISSAPGLYSKRDVSSPFALVAGGLVTFNHNLGRKPKLVLLYLYNLVAEGGYSLNALVPINHQNVGYAAKDGGSGVEIGPTIVNLRFNNTANTFSLVNFATGSAATPINNANWQLIIEVQG